MCVRFGLGELRGTRGIACDGKVWCSEVSRVRTQAKLRDLDVWGGKVEVDYRERMGCEAVALEVYSDWSS